MSDDWFYDAPDHDEATPDESAAEPDLTYTVSDPGGVVGVTAGLDGSTEFIALSPRAAAMSATELAREIVAVSDAATTKALAAQYDIVGLLLAVGGQPDDAVREVLAGMGLPTPEQAAEAQARFAARYLDGANEP
jgi:hypothetical protein